MNCRKVYLAEKNDEAIDVSKKLTKAQKGKCIQLIYPINDVDYEWVENFIEIFEKEDGYIPFDAEGWLIE